jgi:ribonuclease HI
VYDAELHAVQEAVSTLLTVTVPRGTLFISVDNQAAIDTLQSNHENYEYGRRILATIAILQLLGWRISTLWCPSQGNIPSNERADTLAKMAASSTTRCRFTTTTKCWLLT